MSAFPDLIIIRDDTGKEIIAELKGSDVKKVMIKMGYKKFGRTQIREAVTEIVRKAAEASKEILARLKKNDSKKRRKNAPKRKRNLK